MSEVNRQWLLAARPVGMVKESDFELRSSPVPPPGEGQVLARMARGARIVLCGSISRYSLEEPPPGPRNYFRLTMQRGRMEGFVVMDFFHRHAEAAADLQKWVADGSIAWRADVQKGFENAPATLRRLYTGANFGKQLLEL